MDTYPGLDDIVEVLKSNSQRIFGIDLQVNAMDDAAYDEKAWFGRDFELTMLGGYQGPDITAIGKSYWWVTSMNLGEYNNPRVEELLKQGVILSSEEDRAPIYKENAKILSEDLPNIFYMKRSEDSS